MSKVAFLGLGAMGSRMAKNILSAGFELTVWNRTASAADDLVAAGARRASSPRDAAQGADIVIAMLSDDNVSTQIWTDPATGALTGMHPGAIAIETSTLTPTWVAELFQLAAAAGVPLLDAPVSGSTPQAESRQLVIMAGGAPETFAVAKPVLAAMGLPNHVGDSGKGALLKLAVNSLLGVQVAAWAEMLALLQKSGMELTPTLDLLTTMPVCSPSAAGMARLMAAGDYAPRFAAALMAKDFRYVQKTAGELPTQTPIADAASKVFATAAETMGADNLTSVFRLYQS
jgi:3-hydroxyisobutyrate dehydrogenase